MKKILFGTTAIAAAMTAGVAAADSHAGPSVSVSTQAVHSMNFQDSAVQNVHDTFMEDYVEFHVKAKQQVEAFGGLEIGTQIEARTTPVAGSNNSTVDVDEQWSYVSGSFGQVYFGQTDSAAEKAQVHMRGGSMGGLFGIGGVTGALGGPTNNRLVQDFGLGGASYYPTTNMDSVSSDHTKLGYISPKFADMITVSGSWSPTKNNADFLGNNAQADNTAGGAEDAISLAVGLDTEISGVGINAGLQYASQDFEADAALSAAGSLEDETRGHLILTIGDFKFGGSYSREDYKFTNGAGDNKTDYELGLDYMINGGQYIIGATYAHAETDRVAVGASDDEVDFWQVGGSMALAPNARVAVAYMNGDFDSQTVANQGDASNLTIGTFFAF